MYVAPSRDKGGEASFHYPWGKVAKILQAGGQVPGHLGWTPIQALHPPLTLSPPTSSPKEESYSWLFLKEVFEAMSQFFPFLSLGIIYFGRLLFSMSRECHCEAGPSWTASMREQGRSKARPTVKNTSHFISPLKTKPWGPFAAAEPGNRAS